MTPRKLLLEWHATWRIATTQQYMHDPKEEKDPMMCGGLVWGLTPSLPQWLRLG